MSYEPLPRVPDPAYAAPTAMLSVNPDQVAMQASMQPLLNQNVAYGFNQPRDSEVLIKVRYRTAYREFRTANNVSLAQLSGELSTHMNINQARASLGTAYLLWLLFGWMGAHRWYLGKHNALSWFLWFITGQFFVRRLFRPSSVSCGSRAFLFFSQFEFFVPSDLCDLTCSSCVIRASATSGTPAPCGAPSATTTLVPLALPVTRTSSASLVRSVLRLLRSQNLISLRRRLARRL